MNEVWWEILGYLMVILEWLFYYKLTIHLGKSKRPEKKNKIQLGSNILIISLMCLVGIDPNIRVIVAIVLGIVFMLSGYTISKGKAIITGLMFWLALIVLESFAMILIMVFNRVQTPEIFIENTAFRVQVIIVGKLLAYGVVTLICRFTNLYEEFPRKYFIYLGVPVGANIINLFFFYSKIGFKNELFSDRTILMVSTLAITASTVVFLLLQGVVIKDQKEKVHYLMLQDKMEMQHKYYTKLKKEQERVRKLYHDMRNHISCIQLLANNQAANEYVKKINKELEELKDTGGISTGNPILDVILTDKKAECEERGIQFCAEVDFEKCYFVEMIDVTSLFSNIINNAIEACCKVEDEEERAIRIKSTYVDNFFVLVAVNKKQNDVSIVNGEFITDKEDAFVHGLGTKNIREVVEKYEGQVRFEHNEEEFKVKIYLPIHDYVNQMAK